MPAPASRDMAIDMDNTDVLAHKRDAFELADGLIYMCGNSLGPMPKSAPKLIQTTMEKDWAQGLVTSWNKANWFMMTDTIGDRLAKLLGATPGELMLSDTTSLNIYKTLHAAVSMQAGRNTIVCEASSFPTDLYMAEGVCSLLPNMNIKLEGRDASNIDALFDENTAVVLLNQVDYRSGEIRDIKSLTQKAHAVGALVISDVCHSAGVIPVNLQDENVDFAVGCTYKYLNCGPGAPAFVYVAARHHGNFSQPLCGWHGHAEPFNFELDYRAAKGARALLTGTQPILSSIAVNAGLDVFDDVSMHSLYEKSKKLSTLFTELIEHWCTPFGVSLYSPKDVSKTNGQISLAHEHSYSIMQALIERHVMGDFRQPNLMRFGIAPLYLRYVDIWDAAHNLRDILETEQWKEARFATRNLVT